MLGPIEDAAPDGLQGLALFRQAVLHFGWDDGISFSLDESEPFQVLELLRQYFLTDALDLLVQLIEAQNAA